MRSWWFRKPNKIEQANYQNEHPSTEETLFRSIKRKDTAKPKSNERLIFASPTYNSFTITPTAAYSELSMAEEKSYPLPQPSVSSDPSIRLNKTFGSTSDSVSVSSSCSFGSSSDDLVHDHDQSNFDRPYDEIKFSTYPRNPAQISRSFPISTSPQNCQSQGMNSELPTKRHENCNSPCHRLPLPPNSPSKLLNYSQAKWKRGKLIGRGSFGHVYAGFNCETGEMCAIKEVRVISDDPSSKQCLKQLNQEISLLSRLSHQNIVQYYGGELVGDRLSVYLEYVSGGSIYKLLQEYGPFKEPVIQSYTRQIVSGLAYLHGKNTAHRDVKGANILVDSNGEIKLADFGMAKYMTANASAVSFNGSPYWMAPEVVMNTGGYNLAVDIWSLGCTIIEMATSKPPWSHETHLHVLLQLNCYGTPSSAIKLMKKLQKCTEAFPSTRTRRHSLVASGPSLFSRIALQANDLLNQKLFIHLDD
ncbi:Protein kinase domain [Dillenia turbinata]|uniref:mitogen-activated protein kinase kinase kinase n=1 Tax=Dillenia turbinata TaxID=194707 RepID=A0AAN8ZJJ2_9MAGN